MQILFYILNSFTHCFILVKYSSGSSALNCFATQTLFLLQPALKLLILGGGVGVILDELPDALAQGRVGLAPGLGAQARVYRLATVVRSA
mgnify:CR=1 FL=1